jgi:histidine triad (HIT) family protein
VTDDFYCDEVLSGKTEVRVVRETDNVLAYHHTRPFWPAHVVVIPKRHISSLLTLEESDTALLLELIGVVRDVAQQIVSERGACRVLTNLGQYQDSKHLHWHVCSGDPLK